MSRVEGCHTDDWTRTLLLGTHDRIVASKGHYFGYLKLLFWAASKHLFRDYLFNNGGRIRTHDLTFPTNEFYHFATALKMSTANSV